MFELGILGKQRTHLSTRLVPDFVRKFHLLLLWRTHQISQQSLTRSFALSHQQIAFHYRFSRLLAQGNAKIKLLCSPQCEY